MFRKFFHRSLIWIIRGLDAEDVHHWTINLLARLGKLCRNPVLLPLIELGFNSSKKDPKQSLPLFGLNFSHPVGLAAGLDKNGQAIEAWAHMGLAFAELGTVTPLAQPGNPRPRLFRNYQEQMIFNAMGFNNLGAEALRVEIEKARPFLRKEFIVGANIGKNASTALELAHQDYKKCIEIIDTTADYFVINVSSPNTKGLRGLQSWDALQPILSSSFDAIQKLSKQIPLLIKLAPEIPNEELNNLVQKTESQFPLSGWIVCNTLLRPSPWIEASLPNGGISGAPLIEQSRLALKNMRTVSRLPLVSSGGILDKNEINQRLKMGASLVQIYSGLIFNGPGFWKN